MDSWCNHLNQAGIKDRKICSSVVTALNTVSAGEYARKSAMKGGETLKIPQITLYGDMEND